MCIAFAFWTLAGPAAAQEPESAPAETVDETLDETLDETIDESEATGDDGDLHDLESLLDQPVVTTASRGAERASSAPATVFTVSAEEIRTFGMRSIDEALNYLGVGMYSLRVRDYTTAVDTGAQGVLLRDRGRHILVLVDGHVMNSQDTGQIYLNESLGVPLEAIDHIEVMLGAGSVVYGSNAMLAVVNVVTKRASYARGVSAIAELGVTAPSDLDGRPSAPGPDDHPGVRYRFGVGAAAEFELRGSPAEVTVHLEWIEEVSNTYRIPEFDDSSIFDFRPGETTWGGAAHHEMQSPSVVASMSVGDFRLQLRANHYRRTMPLVGLFSDPTSFEERQAVRADLTHEASIDEHLTLATRLYADYSRFAESSDWTAPYWCLPEFIDGCSFTQSGIGRWAGIEQQLTIDWDVDGSIVSTIGYDIRGRDTTGRPSDSYDRITGEAPWTAELPYFHDVSVLGAVFVQQIWQPAEWLELNAGARLDLDSGFGARVSPRAAVTVAPSSATAVRASYSEAFRSPTPFEQEEFDGTYRAPSPGLTPEVARAFELEWQQRIEWLTFNLRAYASFYDDMIDSRVVTAQEFDDALRAGQLSPTAERDYVLRYDNSRTCARSAARSRSAQSRPTG
jgi:outer membrane receptor protein involved in Fe transport